METVLFGFIVFSRSRSRKIQTAETQEDKKGKVWSWYKTNERLWDYPKLHGLTRK